jgi:oligo-1,6-glucosidase
MNREVLSKYNVMTVAEGAGSSPQEAMQFVAPERKELDIAYHFESVEIGAHIKEFGLVKYKDIFSSYDTEFKDKGWLAIFLANHDQPRMVSKFGNDSAEFQEISSKMLSTFILTMRGTPFYYQGDELGMVNIRFDSIDEYHDLETNNKYINLKNKGGDLKAFLETQKQTARDNSRTPFQWDTTENAGFTKGTPWIKVNSNYKTLNAETQEKDPHSTLNYFRQLIKLRKQNPIFVYGTYSLLDPENPNIYAYCRELNGTKLLILLNFTDQIAPYNLSFKLERHEILLDNYNDCEKITDSHLRPYEAMIVNFE